MDEFDQITHRALERLYEDERLRSHLSDDEAKIVMGWAQSWIETQVSAADDPAHAAQIAQSEMARVCATVSAMNALGAKPGELTLAQAIAALEPQVKIQQTIPRENIFKILTELISTLWRMQEEPAPQRDQPV